MSEVAKEERRQAHLKKKRLLKKSDHLIEDVVKILQSAAAEGKKVHHDEIFAARSVSLVSRIC